MAPSARQSKVNEVQLDPLNLSPDEEVKLFECEPQNWKWMHPNFRFLLGWWYLIVFSMSFLLVPTSCLFLMMPWVWRTYPLHALVFIMFLIMMARAPTREWPAARSWAQLWYEIFRVSVNMSPATRQKYLDMGETRNFAICMHPHGIIPFHALLWAAYCDQYMKDEKAGHCLYGFGAVADVVMQLPFLRTMMGWLSCSSAGYKTLKAGLSQGICESVNKAGRIPRHLFILPGGIAEIFTSTPGKNIVIFKKRRGLIKLAIETGTHLIPCYVFGASDFFNNFSTGEGYIAKLGRRNRIGITMFFGHFGLPIPFSPRVTMCFADPLPVEKWTQEGDIPSEMVDKLHSQYIESLLTLFEKYKVAAGYPDAHLEVR